MVIIQVWGSKSSKPSSSLLEKVHRLNMNSAMAYRIDNDGSLLIYLPYEEEKVLKFEEILKGEKFSKVSAKQAGKLKTPHYSIIDDLGVH